MPEVEHERVTSRCARHADAESGASEERGDTESNKKTEEESTRGRMVLNESNYETSFNCAVGGQCVILHCAPLSFPFK
jgi:hypothetical protein